MMPPNFSVSPSASASVNTHVLVVWTSLDAWTPETLDSLAHCWLHAQDFSYIRRFRRSEDQRQRLISRVLTRWSLARLTPFNPCSISIETPSKQKPFARLISTQPFLGVDFNVSHSADVVACATSTSGRLGLDIEYLHRSVNVERIAKRFFAPFEYRLIQDLEAAPRKRRFFEIWTLKEAFLKATGTGLSGGLDALTILESTKRDPEIDASFPGVPLKLKFRHALPSKSPLAYNDTNSATHSGSTAPDSMPDWRFLQFDLSPDYLASIAVEGAPGQPLPNVQLMRLDPVFGATDSEPLTQPFD